MIQLVIEATMISTERTRGAKTVAGACIGLQLAEISIVVIIVVAVAVAVLARRLDLDLRGPAGGRENANGVGRVDVELLGRKQRVVQRVAVGPVVPRLDSVRQPHGDVKNGVVVLAVEAKVLPDRNVVEAAVAIVTRGLAVAHETAGEEPVDVLDGAAGLLEHDGAKGVVVLGGGAVGDGEVAARDIARQEHGDVENARGAVIGVGRQRGFAVGSHVQRDMEVLCAC
ncbi:hypothetical protein HYQ46_007618 [Verticillium longisporum]|nr:hypothetical protein HYQ46_007618 [Verticillium longisporum]